MASPMQARECRKIEETVSSNKNSLENTPSFYITSADTNSNRIDNVNESSEDVKLHVGTFTSDLESKDITIVGNESEVTNQQSVQTPIGIGTEEPMIGRTNTTQSLFDRLIHEDTNLPGNISLRSDSSTTSTNSFAFPILQTEWNNSPVRMAKADRKHLRKGRWRRALICCKF